VRIVPRGVTSVVVTVLCLAGAAAGAADRYWEWGWGSYGSGTDLDVARYDWSLINFGSVPADQTTVDRCNRILALNPQHKFVIRVWPVLSLGNAPENRYQMTLPQYFYQEGTKEKMLAAARAQVEVILHGLTDPSRVVGSCFLEELPSVLSVPRPGEPLPWDFAPFADRIAAELGAPSFDSTKEEHLLWWGRKYCDLLGDVHRSLKQATAGRTVLYWQATHWYTLDHLAAGESCLNPRLNCLPFRYADILKEGVCDGIFGYPNNAAIWQKQTVQMIEKLNCLVFSQTSVPSFMRLCHFDEALEMARWQNPGNLGTFIYVETVGRGRRAWNEMPYVDGTRYWTITDHYRRVGWQHHIGMEVVRRALQPQLLLDYDLTGKQQGGFVHLWAQIYNPRHPSWFGDDLNASTLTASEVALQVPAGFSVPLQNNAGATLRLGDIGPLDCKAGEWWVSVDGDGTIPAGQAFTASVSANGGATRVQASSDLAQAAIPTREPRAIARSGDTWIEPAYRQGIPQPAAELHALASEIVFPELAVGDRRVLYRGTLEAGMRLVIGPGLRARRFDAPVFADDVRRLAAAAAGKPEAGFSDGYLVWSTPAVSVDPGKTYRIAVTGRAENGGNCLVIAHFTGTRGEAPNQSEDVVCFANQFATEERTLTGDLVVPEFKVGTARIVLRFYRFKSAGTVIYKDFDVRAPGFTPDGTDVTTSLEGTLPPLDEPFTRWTYRDLSDPAESGAKISVRLYDPAVGLDAPAAGKPQRVGGEF
jgi:hypothetical protein